MTNARKIKGVTTVDVDQSSATLTLRYDPAQTDGGAVAAAVQAILDRLEYFRRRLIRHHADPLGHLLGLLSGARPSFRDRCFIYVADRGLSRYLLSRRGYAAITLGHVIVSSHELSPALLRHEQRHTAQYEQVGLAFLPLYLLLYRRHGYAKHPLEQDAAEVALLFE